MPGGDGNARRMGQGEGCGVDFRNILNILNILDTVAKNRTAEKCGGYDSVLKSTPSDSLLAGFGESAAALAERRSINRH